MKIRKIFDQKRSAQYELIGCEFGNVRLIVDKTKSELRVYVPFKDNVIQFDNIGLSVNDWMVCTPYEDVSRIASGIAIPYKYAQRPFFNDEIHDACDRLVAKYHLKVA